MPHNQALSPAHTETPHHDDCLKTHPHHHEHIHEHAPAIDEQWKWLTVLGNAAIGAAELVTGNVSTLSVAADGIHNAGDAVTYYMQAEAVLDRDMAEEKRARWRKVAHWAIAASSLAVSAKAGVDLALDHESAPHPLAIYTAGASLLLNGLLFGRLRQGIQRTKKSDGRSQMNVGERDLVKHFLAVDIPSAGLAVLGVATQGLSTAVEQTVAVASGLVGAYAFRPTKANLAHDHHAHGHEHDHSKHVHKRPPWRLEDFYYRHYKRDTLGQIQKNGEQPGFKSSIRAIGQLFFASV